MTDEFFRSPHASVITKLLKANGFIQVDTKTGRDGFKTTRGTLPDLGDAPYVAVKFVSGHVVKALREIVTPDQGDITRAATVLRDAGYHVEISRGTTDIIGVYGQAARDAMAEFEDRQANADGIAATMIREGQWQVETESFPEHTTRRAVVDHVKAREVVAKVLRQVGAKRQEHPHWFPGMTGESVVFWVSGSGPSSTGTIRLTPAAPTE